MDNIMNSKRFSFRIDGADAWDLDYQSGTECRGNEITTVYTFGDSLKVTNIVKRYDKFGAIEWVNYFENPSERPGNLITDLWDCDCTLPMEREENKKWESYFPDPKTATKVYAPIGSVWSTEEFGCDVDKLVGNTRIHHIYPGEIKEYAASEGRSSEERAPFFQVHKNNAGYFFAVGWTGQWKCRISRTNDSITFRSKVEDTCFRLMPGERIRTSSVVILPYCGEIADARNLWRRLVKEHFSLAGQEGRDGFGPLCAGIWGGMKTEAVLERIETIRKNRLPFDYIWMDAGWYGIDTEPSPDEFEGDWPVHTGDWRVSPRIHPQGLKDVSKAVHDAGMKFLLWFEPERVIRTTPEAVRHPEYFLSNQELHNNNRILNLGNPEAWEYCFQTLSGLIEELNIDCYRQDFNCQPLAYWRKNDAPDRKGMTEIRHINGLYRLWDALLKRFPHLMIDNCASGGRRIDIETLRRSIPLWRSDFQCPANYDAEAAQCHSLNYNQWIPYSGTGSGRIYEEYRIRSAYAGALMMGYSYSEREDFCKTEEELRFLQKYTEEYLKVRPYFSEDFYPLTEVSDRTDVWCGMQFHRPAEHDGIVMVFRRESSPYETASFLLRGVDSRAKYLFTDADGGMFTVNGEELTGSGWKLTVAEKRKAKIFFYHMI